MPCSYFIDSNRKVAELTSNGKVTKDEIIQRFKRVFNDQEWVPGYDVISDYTAADIRDLTPDDLDEVLTLAVQMKDKLIPSRFAFVASSDLHYAILRMWAMKGGENIMNMQYFSSRTHALEWLQQAEPETKIPAYG